MADQACSSGSAIRAAAACSLVRRCCASAEAGCAALTAARGATVAEAEVDADADPLALAGSLAWAGKTCDSAGVMLAK